MSTRIRDRLRALGQRRASVASLTELVGIGVIVAAVFELAGSAWGLLALGIALVVVANTRSR